VPLPPRTTSRAGSTRESPERWWTDVSSEHKKVDASGKVCAACRAVMSKLLA
jgi:hypothetical protein